MIVCFPTYARHLPDRYSWRLRVAGMVTRPLPPASRRRTVAVGILRRLLHLDPAAVDSEIFQQRAEAFLFQRVPGQPVWFRIGDRLFSGGVSDRVGHFEAELELDEAFVEDVAVTAGTERWIPFQAEQDEPGAGAAGGRIHLIGSEGRSVISDIDDTVKITNVASRRELLANTFLRDFAAVPGVGALLRGWQTEGTAFHYVSASPWQLADCLRHFLAEAGLPGGSMHLRLFRLKDSTPLGRLPSPKRSKRRMIERILDDFPGRSFTLLGDSGERDPEVYAAVARQRPEQIEAVLIRQVAGRLPETKARQRLDRIGGRLPAGRFRIFTDPAEIA
jgi:phosphatidate phosphatase APP1